MMCEIPHVWKHPERLMLLREPERAGSNMRSPEITYLPKHSVHVL